MYYKLTKPIFYRTLSGSDVVYDCVYLDIIPRKGIQIMMGSTTGLPARLEAVLTAQHIKCPPGLVALRQNANCVEISNELIRRGILTHEASYPMVRSRFVSYKFYRFNSEHFMPTPLAKKVVS